MNSKHIVFDIDGTLIDSITADLTSLQETILSVINKKIEIDNLTFAFGIPGEVALKRLGIEEAYEVNKIWANNFKQHAHTITVFKGIEFVLQELQKQGCKLGIITSRSRTEYTDDFLRFQLTDYFETVICVEDSALPKPAPDPMLEYLKRTGANASDVLYIGDSIYDFQCASNAGVEFGLALWGCTSVKHIYASYFFKAPKDILHTLNPR